MKPDKTGWDKIQPTVRVLFIDRSGKPHKSRNSLNLVTFLSVPNFSPKSDENDNQQKIEITASIKVHVAHYTRSIQEIFKDNQDFLKDVEKTLRKYSVIRKYRDEDYPCDFEPLGWKGNGGLIATYANAQGNTIPVIWRDYRSDNDLISRKDGFSIKEWFALYPRYFNLLSPGKKQDKNEKKDIEKNMDDDIKALECKKTNKCPVNPVKWNKQFFAKHWVKNIEGIPPCKIKN